MKKVKSKIVHLWSNLVVHCFIKQITDQINFGDDSINLELKLDGRRQWNTHLCTNDLD